MKLRDHNWAEIEERASFYIQIADNSSNEGEEAGAASGVAMHANIDIDDW